jgi:hypothetical protein
MLFNNSSLRDISVAVFEGLRGEGCKLMCIIRSRQGSFIYGLYSVVTVKKNISSKCRQPNLCIMCSVSASTAYGAYELL